MLKCVQGTKISLEMWSGGINKTQNRYLCGWTSYVSGRNTWRACMWGLLQIHYPVVYFIFNSSSRSVIKGSQRFQSFPHIFNYILLKSSKHGLVSIPLLTLCSLAPPPSKPCNYSHFWDQEAIPSSLWKDMESATLCEKKHVSDQ